MKKKLVILIIIAIISGTSVSIYLLATPPAQNDYGQLLIFNFPELQRIEFTVNGTIIDDWAYWLQDVDMNRIHDSKYDLIVMDYSSDGCETGEFSSSNVSYMKSSGDQMKLLISYLSIGEAEDYRFYWNGSWTTGDPSWLDVENPEWPGNYKVKYWEVGWQNLVFDYIDRIILAGFDGLYLDIIDAYDYYSGSEPNSDVLMMDFVINISQYSKTQAGENFSIFVQNADELLANTTYLNNIDGIGREDLFYYDNDVTDSIWRTQGIQNLNLAIDENKTVLVIDYPTIIFNTYDFYKNCINSGFLPYASGRDLAHLKYHSFYPPT